MNRKYPPLIAIALLTAGCHPARDESPSVPSQSLNEGAARAKGAAISGDLMETLKAQLIGALSSNDPAQAVAVCRNVAVPTTDAAAVHERGIHVRRTTMKPRNPANAPDELDRRVLEAFATANPPPADRVEPVDDGGYRYYRPLVIAELCLKCHGDPATFPPALVETLQRLYPQDQATGYALGDFRGVICVEFSPRP